MICFTECRKLAKKVLIIIVLLTVPGMLTAQQFRVEGEVGLSLFNISDPVLESNLEVTSSPFIPLGPADVEIDLTHKNPFFIGVYGGYIIGPLEIGGELHFTNSKGNSNDIQFDGETQPDTAGKYDFSIFKIGPVIRYYFNNANPQIEPFAGASVSYASTTIDIDDPSLKVEQTYLDIGIFGGAHYWMEENFYIGGMARIDIFNTIEDDSLTGVLIEVDSYGDFNDITTDGWTPLSLFFVIGTKL